MNSALPFDPRELDDVLRPFGESRNLPRSAYVSDQVFAWEMDRFYRVGWVCAGRNDNLTSPGDQQSIQLAGEGLLLVVADDGSLRGFFNVCRHRAHELLEPGSCAHSAVVRCPYHGWAYSLDGRLKSAPRFGEVAGFKPADNGLRPVAAELWHGWVFVNMSGDAEPFSDWIGDLEGLVSGHRPEALTKVASKTYQVATNWKLVHENYHECYHCPQIHPELCRVTPHDSGRNLDLNGAWIGGRMDLMEHAETMSLDGRSDGVPLPGLNARQLRQIDYYGLLPNLFVSLHPDYVLTHRLEPIAPNCTRIDCEWLFPSAALDKPGFNPAYAFDFWDVTNLQDWKALESVQRGVSSIGYLPGLLSRKEDAVHHFVRRIARGYRTGRLPTKSSAGRPGDQLNVG